MVSAWVIRFVVGMVSAWVIRLVVGIVSARDSFCLGYHKTAEFSFRDLLLIANVTELRNNV